MLTDLEVRVRHARRWTGAGEETFTHSWVEWRGRLFYSLQPGYLTAGEIGDDFRRRAAQGWFD